MKGWYTADELAGIPSMPSTARGVHKQGDRGVLRRRKRAAGKGWEYFYEHLPEPAQRYLMHQAQQTLVPATPIDPPVPATPPPAMIDLSREQRDVMSARLAVLDEIASFGHREGLKQGPAVALFCELSAAGLLDQVSPNAAALVARAKRVGRGGKAVLKRSTVYAWMRQATEGKTAVAPKSRRKKSPPAWLHPLLQLYQRPQKPTVAKCVRDWPKHYPDMPAPPLRSAQRLVADLPEEMREFGRHGKAAMRAIQPFVRRTMDGLWPMDIVTVDGHLFKAYVRHPLTGKRFRPEVTTYLDIATRRAVGFSAWIAESQFAIWIAMRDMVMNSDQGVPAIHYSDNGAYRGEQHKTILTRLGVTPMFSQAYRAQARGVIERFNSSVWVPLAKDLPCYCGQDMDAEAIKKALKKADESGEGLPGWQDFLDGCRQALAEYNGRTHSTLGTSPDAAWAKAVADGWQPTPLDDDDMHDLLPVELRTCRRGEVSLPWGRYSSPDLAAHTGREVAVAFDPMQGDQVWVTDVESGAFLAVAQRDASARGYVHASQLDHARAQRQLGRVGRLERKIADAREEGATQIDTQPLDPQLAADIDRQHAALVAQYEREQQAKATEIGDDPASAYRYWSRVRARQAEGAELTDAEREGLAVYWASDERRSMERYFKSFDMDPLAGAIE